MSRFAFLVVLLGTLVCAVAAIASAPATMSYQGVLKDGNGVLVPDGPYQLTFRLYTVASGGVPIWNETQATLVLAGIFNVMLGSVNSLAGLTFDQPYYLAVSISGDPELTPRVPLGAAPYARMARSIEPDVVSSISGVHNDEGNIDLVGVNGITVLPDPTNRTIAISGASALDFPLVSYEAATQTITGSPQTYGNLNVHVESEQAGFLTVTVDAWVQLNHVQGTEDYCVLGLSTSPTSGPSPYDEIVIDIPASFPTTGLINETRSCTATFSVTAGVPLTVYFVGFMLQGQDTLDRFWFGEIDAVLHAAAIRASEDIAMKRQQAEQTLQTKLAKLH